jgi:hypothetical protein
MPSICQRRKSHRKALHGAPHRAFTHILPPQATATRVVARLHMGSRRSSLVELTECRYLRCTTVATPGIHAASESERDEVQRALSRVFVGYQYVDMKS